MFWIHYNLADLFLERSEFGDANAHTERTRSNVVNDAYQLGRAMQMQAPVWYYQRRLETAKSEALLALDIYDKFGAAQDADVCRDLLLRIDQAIKNRSTSS